MFAQRLDSTVAYDIAKALMDGFNRDFLHHLHHSSARFRIAPGTKGMVMPVFFLPSFPYDRHKRCQARPLQKLKRKSDV